MKRLVSYLAFLLGLILGSCVFFLPFVFTFCRKLISLDYLKTRQQVARPKLF